MLVRTNRGRIAARRRVRRVRRGGVLECHADRPRRLAGVADFLVAGRIAGIQAGDESGCLLAEYEMGSVGEMSEVSKLQFPTGSSNQPGAGQ